MNVEGCVGISTGLRCRREISGVLSLHGKGYGVDSVGDTDGGCGMDAGSWEMRCGESIGDERV